MSASTSLVLLWLGFAGTHMLLSSVRIRPRLVARLGEPAYLGVYSLVALAFFVPLVWTYFGAKHVGPWLWTVPRGPVLDGILHGGIGLAFVLMAASFSQPNPSALGAKGAKAGGIFLIARHPLFMGIGLFALMHLVVNASTSDVAFFGGMVLFSIVGTLHQDRRKLLTVSGYGEFRSATPFLPFTGRDTVRGLRGLSPIGVVAGIGLTVVLRLFHGSLFGP